MRKVTRRSFLAYLNQNLLMTGWHSTTNVDKLTRSF